MMLLFGLRLSLEQKNVFKAEMAQFENSIRDYDLMERSKRQGPVTATRYRFIMNPFLAMLAAYAIGMGNSNRQGNNQP